VIWRWLFAVLLLAHGAIHLIGFFGPTGLAEMEGLPGRPTVLLTGFAIGSPMLLLFGAVWLAAGAGFLLAGVAVLMRQSWWLPVAAATAVLSTILVVLWWNDAAFGVVPNVVVFALIFLGMRSSGMDRAADRRRSDAGAAPGR